MNRGSACDHSLRVASCFERSWTGHFSMCTYRTLVFVQLIENGLAVIKVVSQRRVHL